LHVEIIVHFQELTLCFATSACPHAMTRLTLGRFLWNIYVWGSYENCQCTHIVVKINQTKRQIIYMKTCLNLYLLVIGLYNWERPCSVNAKAKEKVCDQNRTTDHFPL
jgi:hypothetical protein